MKKALGLLLGVFVGMVFVYVWGVLTLPLHA
jgi:hypothetical protein